MDLKKSACRCKINKFLSKIETFNKRELVLCSELKRIIKILTKPGKGIANLENLTFPQCLDIFSSDELSKSCTAVILNVELALELLKKPSKNLSRFIGFLYQNKLISGAKVDKKAVALFGTFNEMITQGLDDLQAKCVALKKNNFQFTTWKSVFKISEIWPSDLVISQNAIVAARYASIVQSAKMVPIIHLEILKLGDYSINRSEQVHDDILSHLIKALIQYHVYLEGIILMIGVITAGVLNSAYIEPEMIAEYTLRILSKNMPAAVPGILIANNNEKIIQFLIYFNTLTCSKGSRVWDLSFCLTLDNNKCQKISECTLDLLEKLEMCRQAAKGKLDLSQIPEKDNISAENWD